MNRVQMLGAESCIGALRSGLLEDDLGALSGIYCAGHEREIVIIRNDHAYAGDAYALDIMADDDVFTPSKRALRRARQAPCNALLD